MGYMISCHVQASKAHARFDCLRELGHWVIWPRGSWKNLEAVEYATLEWVDWFNNRRLLEPIGDIPPAEFEQAYYDQPEGLAIAA